MNEIDEEKRHVIRGAKIFGGSFAQALLGNALAYADSQNVLKIKSTWPEYWQQYLLMGQDLIHRPDEVES